MFRFLERLFGRGWGKPFYDDSWDRSKPSDEPLVDLLAPCALASNRPHFYGRRDARGTRCLRCGFERTGK